MKKAFVIVALLVSSSALGASPCCTVTAFDTATGVVTAVDYATKQQFQFKVNPAEPAGITIGLRFDADLVGKTASVGGKAYPVLNITKVAPGAPCCNIIAIDAPNQVITAKNTATGQTFAFKVYGAEPAGFKIGQAVSADFAAGSATVVSAQYPIMNVQGAKVFLGAPCCSVQSINGGVLTVLDKTSGKTLQMTVTSRTLLGQIKVGQQLYSTALRDAFSVDGAAPCCAINK